jgi:hypothetical protein
MSRAFVSISWLVSAILFASIGTPAAAQWTRHLNLVHAPFDHGEAPDAIVHAPPGFDPRAPLRLVVFLHGYRGCAEVLFSEGESVRCRPGDPPERGWGLAARHDEAGTNTLFVVVQLALMTRDGSPGSFVRPGRARAFFDELLSAIESELGSRRSFDDLASITLLAHSAAFETTMALVRVGQIEDKLRHIVLFDALYNGGPLFLSWARNGTSDAPRRLVSFHGGRGRTAERNRELARRAMQERGIRISIGDDARIQDARDREVVIIRTNTPHAAVPSRHLSETLRALGLPLRG